MLHKIIKQQKAGRKKLDDGDDDDDDGRKDLHAMQPASSAETEGVKHFLGLDTPLKKCLFWGYVASWTLQGLCVHSAIIHDEPSENELSLESGSAPSTKQGGHHKLMYNVTAMVVMIEAVKLVASTYMYHHFDYVAGAAWLPSNWKKVFLYYFIPATMYAIYNNLAHVILSEISPSTYYVPLQLRLLTTALIFSFVFKKRFSKQKWIALSIITGGCMLKEIGSNFLGSGSESIPVQVYMLLAFQIFASTSASVACEVLLKDFKSIPTNMQNIFMYVSSIIVNQIGMLLLSGGNRGSGHGSAQGIQLSAFTEIVFRPLPLFICLNGAAGGVLTGFLLANLTSVHKALAVTLEIVLLGTMSSILFGTELGMIGSVSVIIVAAGTFLYSGYTYADLVALLQGGSVTKESNADKTTNLPVLNKVENGDTPDKSKDML